MGQGTSYNATTVANQRAATIMVAEEADAGAFPAARRARRNLGFAGVCLTALAVGAGLRTQTQPSATPTAIAEAKAIQVVEAEPVDSNSQPFATRATTAPADVSQDGRKPEATLDDATTKSPPTPSVETKAAENPGTAGPKTDPGAETHEPTVQRQPKEATPAAPVSTEAPAAQATQATHDTQAAATPAPQMPPITASSIAAVDDAINELTATRVMTAPTAPAATTLATPPVVEATNPASTAADAAQPEAQATTGVAGVVAAAVTNRFGATTDDRRVHGRYVLEPSDQLTLYRLTPKDSDTPVTQSLTKYADANVACESQNAKKSCFVSLITDTTGVSLKMRIGAAQISGNTDDETTTATPAKRPGGGLRYAVMLEGPPGVDPSTGYTLIAQNAFGVLPTTGRCNAEKCTTVAEIDPIAMQIVGSKDDSVVTVTATTAQRPGSDDMAIVWRFPANGL